MYVFIFYINTLKINRYKLQSFFFKKIDPVAGLDLRIS